MRRSTMVAALTFLAGTAMAPMTVVAQSDPPARSNADPFDDGFAQGEAAAAEVPTAWGWFGKGLLGGLIGGPIGTGVAFSLAGRSEIQPPEGAPTRSGRFNEGFLQGYNGQVKIARQEKAFVGGMIGTVVWGWVILRSVNLVGGGGQSGTPGGTDTVNRVPIGITIPFP